LQKQMVYLSRDLRDFDAARIDAKSVLLETPQHG
jgi:hypothetical protein